ncbi:MAG TPA: TRAP transporter small permease subunit [Burkholderiaceae bacterium]|nr:TRAP transporter small permease subunit [Burkholderiaceae bacterium]
MKSLLGLAHAIDAINARIARVAIWAVLVAVLVSAGNAAVRYLLSDSSNAWLELQWYLFAATVMLGAPFVLKVNEHVRVDVVYSRLAPRRQAAIDLFGFLVFLLPAIVLLGWMSWPYVVESWRTGETSSNAGGLIRWPFKALVPLGCAMLAAQGVAEVVKRVAYLRGDYAMDTHYERPLQ